jgi:hypothetical protein
MRHRIEPPEGEQVVPRDADEAVRMLALTAPAVDDVRADYPDPETSDSES